MPPPFPDAPSAQRRRRSGRGGRTAQQKCPRLAQPDQGLAHRAIEPCDWAAGGRDQPSNHADEQGSIQARVRVRRTEFGDRIVSMDASKDVEPVTVLKRDAAALIERARERSSPILITQKGRPTAVLQDVESFERQRRALLLFKLLAQAERDYESERSTTHAEVDDRILSRLRALQGG